MLGIVIKIKYIICIIFFMLFNGELYAIATGSQYNLKNEQVVVLVKNHAKVGYFEPQPSHETVQLRDCTVTIQTDGMDLEVTFHDVSWLQCTLIKVGKWFQDTF